MIKILQNKSLSMEIDPNPNGLPFLWITVKYGDKIETHLALSKDNINELLVEFQFKMIEM
jgi:hypothetical protein